MRAKALLVFFLLSVSAGVLAWRLWPRYLLWSAEKELNALYASYRPFPYRWNAAPFARWQENLHHSCTPVSEEDLVSARLHIARGEKRTGRTSKSLQLLGRRDLLSCNSEAAIHDYKLALLLDPNNPSLELELGIAFAVDSEMDPTLEHQGALDYETGLEAMLRAGRKNVSPEFLFDTALFFEKAQMPNQAAKQWIRAVNAEQSSTWRNEDEKWLSQLTDKIEARRLKTSELTVSPDSFLAHTGEASEGAELALDAAIENWLPTFYDSSNSRLALEKLGRILLSQHQDRWLLDVIKTRSSSVAKEAFADLAQAIQSNIRGEHLKAFAFASDAVDLFRKSQNSAGELRARLERVYSLDRRSESSKCMQALEGMESETRNLGYKWVEAQARLEDVTCRTRTRREDVTQTRKDAYEWIRDQTHYDGLALRALGFMTEEYVSADSRLTLWRRGERGLRLFWSKPLPPIRGYAFYFTLASSARKAGDREAAMALLGEGTALLRDTGVLAIRALLLSSLACWQLEAGHEDEARTTFSEADKEFASVGASEVQDFQRETQVAHAQALISAGQVNEGLGLLQNLTSGLPPPYLQLTRNVRRLLLPAFGNAYLRLNDLQRACENYLQAIEENGEDLKTLRNREQRDNSVLEIEPAWRGLTEVKLRLKQPGEALAIWESFRSARSRDPTIDSSSCSSATAAKLPHPPPGTTLVAYAFLPSGLSAWSLDSDGIKQYWLNDHQARVRAPRFTELVATPDAPMEAISRSARELFKLLLGPFSGELPEKGVLQIDAEGALASIPWSALEDSHGQVLLERFATVQSVGWAEGLAHAKIGPDTKGLIFGPPSLEGELAIEYPALPDASVEAQRLRARLPNSLFFQNADANKETFIADSRGAELFQFAGHGVSNGGFGALLMASSSDAGQYLTANEITGLDLHSMQLVLLAACSAGVGEQSGVVNLDGLTRAFLEAGAHRVIAADWEVDSRLTAHLIDIFYDHLLAGEAPAEALRKAQLKLRFEAPNPYFWAGFQVFGEP